MRKTFFPSALFGLCSTSLLLFGLSSLRTDPRLFAQVQHPAHPAHSNAATSDIVLVSDHGDWANSDELTLADDEQNISNSDIDPRAWDTGPVPGDPLASDPKAGYTTPSEPSGYRYYYRFIAEDAWSEGSSSADQSGDDSWLWLSDSSEPTEDAQAHLQYGFIDEYSSEEAARYEMAQEASGQQDASELAESDGYFPWYEKYYYFLDTQAEVGRRYGRCAVSSSQSSLFGQSRSDRLITAGELDAILSADRAEAFSHPDYEADVAAGWLFAAHREIDVDNLAVHGASSDLLADFDGGADEADAEAYEQWDALEDDESASFNEENPQSGLEETMDNASDSTSFEGSSSESYLRDDSAVIPAEEGEDYESWIIVNHEPIVGTSPDDDATLSLAATTDTPWHGEPGENFVWLEESKGTESGPDLLIPENQTESDASMMNGDGQDQFEWVDPYDDRYYDYGDSSGERTDESGMGREDESSDPITGWNADWDENGFAEKDSGEAWDYDRPGYRPSETAPAVGDSYEQEFDDWTPAAGESEGFESDDGDSVSLRRMGSALLGLIPHFRLGK